MKKHTPSFVWIGPLSSAKVQRLNFCCNTPNEVHQFWFLIQRNINLVYHSIVFEAWTHQQMQKSFIHFSCSFLVTNYPVIADPATPSSPLPPCSRQYHNLTCSTHLLPCVVLLGCSVLFAYSYIQTFFYCLYVSVSICVNVCLHLSILSLCQTPNRALTTHFKCSYLCDNLFKAWARTK